MLSLKVTKRWCTALLSLAVLPVFALAGPSTDPGRMLSSMQQMKNKIQAGLQVREQLQKSSSTRLMKVQTTGSISGTVFGVDDADIPTGWVMAWAEKNSGDSSLGNFGISTLQPDGSYEISGLNPGSFYVYAQADGYMSRFFPNAEDANEAKPVFVRDGRNTPNIDFRLKKLFAGAGAISGTILDKSTNLPIKGASVYVWSGHFGPTTGMGGYGWATSDENGNYKILNLHAGKYMASAWANGYKYETYGGTQDSINGFSILVVDSVTTENINFDLIKTASISGRVTKSNGDLLQWAGVFVSTGDSGGGDSIKPAYPNYGGGYGYTDSEGYYTVDNLPDGDYTAVAEGYTRWGAVTEWYNESATREGAQTISVLNGIGVKEINFTLDFPVYTGSISGKVLNSAGNGMANAGVVIYTPFDSDSSDMTMPPMGQHFKFYTTTDQEGNYNFSEIPDGSYYVRSDSYNTWSYTVTWYPASQTEESAELVSIQSGAKVTGIDIQTTSSQTNGTISGTVKKADGTALAGAYIMLSTDYRSGWKDGGGHHKGNHRDGGADNHGDSLYWNPIWATAISDSFGNYSIGSLPKGSYLIQAYYYNYSDGKAASIWYNQSETAENATAIIITGDQTITGIDFNLTPKSFYGSLSGTVKNNSGEIIQNAYVELIPYWEAVSPSDKYLGRWNLNTLTDAEGKFSFTQLYEGKYTLVAYTNGGYVYYPDAITPNEADSIVVLADQNTDLGVTITLKNAGAGSISGSFSTDFETLVPISGVVLAKPVITIQSYPESQLVFSGVAKDGMYKIPGLQNGEYHLYAFSGMAIGEFYNNVYDPALAQKVVVADGKETTGIDFTLSGHFCGDGGEHSDSLNNLNGGRVYGKIKDNSEKLLGDVSVNLIDADGVVITSSKSNSKGYYELAGLPAGQYSVKASHLGMEMVTVAEPMTMNKNSVQLDIVMKPAGAPTNVDDDSTVPSSIQLVSVYPNPFNPETTISFRLPAAGNVTVQIYNMLGQQINILSATSLNAGLNQIRWSGRSNDGTPASSGVYLFRILAGNQVTTGKMILAK